MEKPKSCEFPSNTKFPTFRFPPQKNSWSNRFRSTCPQPRNPSTQLPAHPRGLCLRRELRDVAGPQKRLHLQPAMR